MSLLVRSGVVREAVVANESGTNGWVRNWDPFPWTFPLVRFPVKNIRFALLGLFIAMTLAFIPACGQKDDVTAIRTIIKQGAAGAEKHDIEGIMKLASEDLRVLPGDVDRREVKRILWMAFRHYGDLKVIYPQPEVNLEKGGRHAAAQFPFLIVKKDQSFPQLNDLFNDPQKWVQEVGERADLYRLSLRLSKNGDQWLVNEAHLQGFTGVGFSE